MNRFERFCSRHRNAGIPRLTLLICSGMAVMSILLLLSEDIYNLIYFNPVLVLRGDWWRIFFFFFSPPNVGGSVITMIIFNFFCIMFFYWIGSSLEQVWGRFKFNIYYFGGVLLTIAYSFIFSSSFIYLIYAVPVTNSYIMLSLLLAFAMYNPDAQIRLYFVLPVKMKWFALFSLVIYLWPLIEPIFTDKTYTAATFLPLAALLNFALFFSGDLIKMAKRGGQKRQYHKNTAIPFQKAARESKQRRGYLHKCTACGVTDTDNPDMEFRYCSLCSGYQCYCSQHVFTHEHLK